MFFGTPNNLVICANESNINRIMDQIEDKKCSIFDCSLDWRKNRKRLDKNNNCLDNCKSNNNYEYNGICYSECSNKIIKTDDEDHCEKICPEDLPFLLIYEQICVSYCDINDINKTCFLTYEGNNTEDLMLDNILKNLKTNRKEYINEGNKIIIKEKDSLFTISRFTNNNLDSDYCKESFNNHYNDIYLNNQSLYFLNISIYQDGLKEFYEIYYFLESEKSLKKLDLKKLDDDCYLKTEITKCENYSIQSLIKEKCITCEKDFHPIDNYDTDTFLKCFNSPEGYFLDTINQVYKQCHLMCKLCNNKKLLPHNKTCINDCSKDDIYKYEFNNTCYEACPNNTKQSKNNNYICEIKCPENAPYELVETHECISNYSIRDLFKNDIRINYKQENLDKKIIEEILNGNLKDLIEQALQNKSDIIITDFNSIHQITSLSNQMNNNEYNLSYIDFGDCEQILRNESLNDSNEELLLYKIENKIEGFNIPIIDYVLFNKNGDTKLNLSLCENIKIKYNIPVNINDDELYKYDPSSDFYNNECNKYSKNGNLDMTLYERKNEFNNNNLSLCEWQCEFKGYNSSTMNAICDCNIKNNIIYSDKDINEDDLLIKINAEKGNSNLGITQCYNVFTSTEEIKSNSGFFLLLIIIIIFIIVFIIFCIKEKNSFENKIDNIIYKKFDKNKKKNKIKKAI